MKQITAQDIPTLYKNQTQPLSYYQYRKWSGSSGMRVESLFAVEDRKCAYPDCDVRLALTVDHIVPIAVAYRLNWPWQDTRDIKNLQPLCRTHHTQKDQNVMALAKIAYRYSQKDKFLVELARIHI